MRARLGLRLPPFALPACLAGACASACCRDLARSLPPLSDLYDAVSEEEARLQQQARDGTLQSNGDYGAQVSEGGGAREECRCSWRRTRRRMSYASLHTHNPLLAPPPSCLPACRQVSALLEELARLRAADPAAKVVVLSSWGRLLRMVDAALTANGVGHATLCGANPKQRLDALDAFLHHPDCTVLTVVMSSSGGAAGLTLTVAQTAIIMEVRGAVVLGRARGGGGVAAAGGAAGQSCTMTACECTRVPRTPSHSHRPPCSRPFSPRSTRGSSHKPPRASTGWGRRAPRASSACGRATRWTNRSWRSSAASWRAATRPPIQARLSWTRARCCACTSRSSSARGDRVTRRWRPKHRPPRPGQPPRAGGGARASPPAAGAPRMHACVFLAMAL